MRRRIGRGPRVRVGRNVWYFRRGRNSRQIFKVQGGRVREMGIADARLTATRPAPSASSARAGSAALAVTLRSDYFREVR